MGFQLYSADAHIVCVPTGRREWELNCDANTYPGILYL
jgi:hypothetical protein